MPGQAENILMGGSNKSVTLREHPLTYRLSGSAEQNDLRPMVSKTSFAQVIGRIGAEFRTEQLPRGAGGGGGGAADGSAGGQ